MKIVLILMVKNESRILRRCLESVEGLVDAVCIHDTGSTDDTRDIVSHYLATHRGCLSESVFQDFGTNRTESFEAARRYVRECGWDLGDTYGLLLDADMVFQAGTLNQQVLTEIGYTIVQCAGTLEYPNCRLVRMDYPWKCVGVTHEYWDGPTRLLPKTTCWIDDRNDGGCKSDKFERDARLLETGLEEDPTNVRYMFYLAQSYKCLGRYEDSIAMYKRRIQAGGWCEEVWYSHYMIGECYLLLKDPIEFEAWMLRAYAYRPARAEPLYKLAKYFRERSQHYKAYQYVAMGSEIPFPSDSLFIESDVYRGLFDYERSILDYYVKSDRRDGLISSVRYLLRSSVHQASVLSNLKFYAKPLGDIRPLDLPRPFGETFVPSAISIHRYPYANVRYINYWMDSTGAYKTPHDEPVRTENAYIHLETGEVVQRMDDASVALPRVPSQVLGLEDVRLSGDTFTATVREYGDGIRVMEGTYDAKTGNYENCRILPSPHQRPCEKNWLAAGDSYIYDWHPFHVLGQPTVPTPPLFSLFRGSAPPVPVGDHLWSLVHCVEYSSPRTYYHCFVKHEPVTYKPLAATLPFVFRSPSVEYCISIRPRETAMDCYVSFMDKDPAVVTVSFDLLEWVGIEIQ